MIHKLSAIALLLFVSTVQAQTINEEGDAGPDRSTAQRLFAGVTSINGELSDGLDTDLYRFTLDSDATFTIEVLEIDTALDMNLIVFNSLGQGLAGDDDDNNGCTPVTVLGSLDSCLTLTLTAGSYFFGVGDNNMGAFESIADFNAATDFIDNDSGILAMPTTETLGLIGPEFGPGSPNDVGRYVINFSQPTEGPLFRSVPTLSNLSLAVLVLLMGIVGLRARAARQ